MTRRSGRWRRGLLSALGALVALLGLWLALAIHPQPLFAHELTHALVQSRLGAWVERDLE
ncbi:MAG: hypothetical protein M3020_07780 [Myxococcota bacterium]|nr:hypothetical protein [Myxococcota bacterium]